MEKGVSYTTIFDISLTGKVFDTGINRKNVQNVKQGALALCFAFILLLCVKLTFYA